MIFALILLMAVAISFFVSPLIAIVLVILGAVVFLLLFGMRRSGEAEGGASSTPGSHAARRLRRGGTGDADPLSFGVPRSLFGRAAMRPALLEDRGKAPAGPGGATGSLRAQHGERLRRRRGTSREPRRRRPRPFRPAPPSAASRSASAAPRVAAPRSRAPNRPRRASPSAKEIRAITRRAAGRLPRPDDGGAMAGIPGGYGPGGDAERQSIPTVEVLDHVADRCRPGIRLDRASLLLLCGVGFVLFAELVDVHGRLIPHGARRNRDPVLTIGLDRGRPLGDGAAAPRPCSPTQSRA